jgi:metal-dependent amidase/aminoacylase/carboxypeptidase family protein
LGLKTVLSRNWTLSLFGPTFYQNPGLGFHEERTGSKAAQYLRELGLDVRSRVLLIGLRGGGTDPAIFAQIMGGRGDV